MSRFALVLFKLALALAALASPLAADVHPNTAGGLPVNQAFAGADIDNVNLFNGSLTIAIPIGPAYPVNSGFSYRLQVVYNSNPWMFQTVGRVLPGQTEEMQYTQAVANPCSNAGMGWRVSFGRINPPCQVPDANGVSPRFVYQDEIGTDHVFYPTLHPDEAPHNDLTGHPDVLYTRDSTYLRLVVLSGGTTRIDFPDGSKRTFDGSGRPTDLRDAFGNGVSIDYGTPNQWILHDSVGRTQTIFFNPPVPNYPPTIDRVELTAFGSSSPAVYRFVYSSSTVGRACPHNDNVGIGNIGDTDTDSFLIGLTLPDGSTYSVGTTGNYLTTAAAGCTPNGGNLLSLTVPTGAEHRYTWQIYRFPTGSASKPHLQQNPGLATRQVIDPLGVLGSTSGTWTYQTGSLFPTGPELKNTMIDPLGHRAEHFFSIALDSAPGTPLGFGPGDLWDYSLPFTRVTTTSGGALFLSSRTYELTGSPPAPVLRRSEYVRFERDKLDLALTTPDLYNANRRTVRSRTVFEDDGQAYADAAMSDFDGLGHYRQQAFSGFGFQGISSRTHTTGANPTNGSYAVDVQQNQASGNFTPVGIGAPWVLETATYVQDVENAQTARTDLCYRPGTNALERKRVRRSTAGGLSGNDLLTVFDLTETINGLPVVQGNVASERTYGGDGPGQTPLGTGATDLCALPIPATPDFRIDHTYVKGVRATSQYSGFNFKVLDQTIDANTGLPSSSTDSAGIATGYEYDAMGRVQWVKPAAGHGGWTEYVYNVRTPLNPIVPNVVVRHRDNGSKSAAILASNQVQFDGTGRVSREFNTLPGTVTAKRDATYDNAGNRATVSEWFTGPSASGTTTFSGFDPFGRPKQIVPPDGSSHAVNLSYTGVRQVSRTVKVATATSGAETNATTTETYDRFGRLRDVTEPSGSAGGTVTTVYTYDVGGRLASTSTQAVVGGTSVTQNRTFSYDAAGLLVSETHPEKGASGNGTVFYPKYDSHGHLLRKTDGPSDLIYTYDRADRLTEVREATGGQRVLKTFAYGGPSGNFTDPATGAICLDWRFGKLTQQSRFNYVTISGTPYTVEIREAMNYCGRDGRVSHETLENRVNGAVTPNESFVLPNITYDALGNVISLSYPQCTHAACTAPSPRTVTDSYSQGLLTSVGIPNNAGYYATSISYHPNGMINQVVHNNNPSDATRRLTDTYALDPFGMSRPQSIVTTTPSGTQRWVYGNYSYDGAGNIKAIGSQLFAYDPVSRLTTAKLFLEAVGAATAKSNTFTYDPFGNLLSIAFSTNPGDPPTSTRNTPTTPGTNRLTGGSFDAAGNLTGWNGNLYEYDPFHLMWHYKTGTVNNEWVYLYTADDERVWTYKVDNTSLWTLRAPSGSVLREYTTSPLWGVQDDLIYRGGLLLASEQAGGVTRHLHLDHLGTPRLISDTSGNLSSYHVYYPYGEEATALGQDGIREKFTGHERDLGNPTSGADDLDYMHARFYSNLTGRFMSTDQHGVEALFPQSSNRYAYVEGNPLKYLDPNGLELQAFFLATGSTLDLTRHAAIYFRDSARGRETDLVFSHGGMANGVNTLAGYLSNYLPKVDPTVAYRLNLSKDQVRRLFDDFRRDYERRTMNHLVYVGEAFSELTNNCTQFACRKILAETSSWDSAKGILSEVINVVDKVNPEAPVIYTNDALLLLRALGILGGVEKGLESPSGAPSNVVVYWSYFPAKK